jgi:hypothetical protein
MPHVLQAAVSSHAITLQALRPSDVDYSIYNYQQQQQQQQQQQ